MSTLYKPVLIESAEQAEAFPVGTIAFDPDYGVATRVDYGLGWSLNGESDSDYHGHIVGFTALVPIEAEEECQDIDAYDMTGHMRRHHLTRHATPWEAAS